MSYCDGGEFRYRPETCQCADVVSCYPVCKSHIVQECSGRSRILKRIEVVDVQFVLVVAENIH